MQQDGQGQGQAAGPGADAQEGARLNLYAPQGDVEGLAAYALHRQALLAFRAGFALRHGRAPDAAEEGAFLLGEETPGRIAAYRAQVHRAQGRALTPDAGATKASPKKRARWPFFGQWIEAPVGHDPEAPVNWRGLLGRLAVLLGAVVATALLLRALFVKA